MSQPESACPFPREIFIPPKRIERICAEALESVGLMPEEAEAIRIDRFIEKFFGIGIGYDDLGKRFEHGVMGACRFSRDGKVAEIIVDTSLGEDDSKTGARRERSTMAHEAGHGLFHGDLFAEKFQADEEIDRHGWGDAVCRQNVFAEGFACRGLGERPEGSRYEWWEYQANKAMAALLLPRKLVDPFLREHLKPRKLGYGGIWFPELETVCGWIADTFDVSVTMARYRIEADYGRLTTQLELL